MIMDHMFFLNDQLCVSIEKAFTSGEKKRQFRHFNIIHKNTHFINFEQFYDYKVKIQFHCHWLCQLYFYHQLYL